MAKEKKPPRGRPKGSGYFDSSINVRMAKDLRDKVEKHGKRKGFRNNSDAARNLIQRGLEAEGEA